MNPSNSARRFHENVPLRTAYWERRDWRVRKITLSFQMPGTSLSLGDIRPPIRGYYGGQPSGRQAEDCAQGIRRCHKYIVRWHPIT